MTEFFFWYLTICFMTSTLKKNSFCNNLKNATFFVTFFVDLKTKLLYFTSKKINEICIPTLRSFVKLQSLENWCSGKLIKKNLFAMHFFCCCCCQSWTWRKVRLCIFVHSCVHTKKETLACDVISNFQSFQANFCLLEPYFLTTTIIFVYL